MAGDSAEEVARRAREKAERLLQQAERFEKGAAGERIVAELLKQLPDDWFVLNDIHWPGRSRANIDHVVIGPSGVFVIDAKNWSGAITIKGDVLRCGGYPKTRTVESVQAAAQAVGSLLPPVHPNFIIPVLCFVGEAEAHGSVSGVEVCAGAPSARTAGLRRESEAARHSARSLGSGPRASALRLHQQCHRRRSPLRGPR